LRKVDEQRAKINVKAVPIRVFRGRPDVYRPHNRVRDIPVMFSKESILLDIAGQNFAGKPCHIAKISGGKISYKAHVFH
jgi:hypothetical protein